MDKNYYFKSLPRRVRAEIEELLLHRGGNIGKISEIRLRSVGLSSVYLGLQRHTLTAPVSQKELSLTLEMLLSGSAYSHLDTIKDGYVALEGGVRVGVSGRARYDGDRLFSFDEPTSLVFRIPSENKIDASFPLSVFREGTGGMLVFSPPRYGKTALLRTLASELSYGRDALEVALLDERLEFSYIDRRSRSLDLLSGYKKRAGIEIALRSLSPEVIIMDELSGEDECSLLLEFMRGGVRVIASAHAGSREELLTKAGVGLLIEKGVFGALIGIEINNGERVYRKYD